jgi:hypothetical protein
MYFIIFLILYKFYTKGHNLIIIKLNTSKLQKQIHNTSYCHENLQPKLPFPTKQQTFNL